MLRVVLTSTTARLVSAGASGALNRSTVVALGFIPRLNLLIGTITTIVSLGQFIYQAIKPLIEFVGMIDDLKQMGVFVSRIQMPTPIAGKFKPMIETVAYEVGDPLDGIEAVSGQPPVRLIANRPGWAFEAIAAPDQTVAIGDPLRYVSIRLVTPLFDKRMYAPTEGPRPEPKQILWVDRLVDSGAHVTKDELIGQLVPVSENESPSDGSNLNPILAPQTGILLWVEEELMKPVVYQPHRDELTEAHIADILDFM
ncbi:MAG: hypothetical protein AAGA48_34220 [Myxococcota bacterium]